MWWTLSKPISWIRYSNLSWSCGNFLTDFSVISWLSSYSSFIPMMKIMSLMLLHRRSSIFSFSCEFLLFYLYCGYLLHTHSCLQLCVLVYKIFNYLVIYPQGLFEIHKSSLSSCMRLSFSSSIYIDFIYSSYWVRMSSCVRFGWSSGSM